MSDLDTVFAAAKANPRDALTIQALADAFEELAASKFVRAIDLFEAMK